MRYNPAQFLQRLATPSLLALAGALALSTAQAAPVVTGIQFGVAEVKVSEASKAARVTLIRTGSLIGAVSAAFSTADGTATAGQDYLATNVTVTLPSGVASTTVAIPILSDTIHEPAETVSLILTGTKVGPRTSAVLSILDNDPAGTISFASSAFTAKENAGPGLVQLVRVSGTASEVSVLCVASEGTALPGVDFTGVTNRVIFAAKELSKWLPIPLLDDTIAEGNETMLLQILEPEGGASLGRQTNATLTLADDEIALEFSRATYRVPEQGRAAVVTLLRSGPLDDVVTVNLSTTANGTAKPGIDYTPMTNVIVRFPVRVAARTVAVALKDNTFDEPDRTVELALSDPSAPAQLGTIATTVVTLVDNDAGGTISFSAATFNTTEAAGKTPVTVRRTGGAAGGVSARFRTRDGTATAGTDYTGVDTNLVFKPGELTKTVFLPVINDVLVEDTETVLLTLSDATGGAVLGVNAEAVLRIANDDLGGAISFTQPEFKAFESNRSAVVTLARTGGLAGGVTVQIEGQGGTISLGADLTGLPATGSFAPGSASAQVTLVVAPDSLLAATCWRAAARQ